MTKKIYKLNDVTFNWVKNNISHSSKNAEVIFGWNLCTQKDIFNLSMIKLKYSTDNYFESLTSEIITKDINLMLKIERGVKRYNKMIKDAKNGRG